MAASHLPPYDPSKPITLGNWPPGLKLPPKRRQQEKKPEKQPIAESPNESPWDFSDLLT